jgi:hypothetical protein
MYAEAEDSRFVKIVNAIKESLELQDIVEKVGEQTIRGILHQDLDDEATKQAIINFYFDPAQSKQLVNLNLSHDAYIFRYHAVTSTFDREQWLKLKQTVGDKEIENIVKNNEAPDAIQILKEFLLYLF